MIGSDVTGQGRGVGGIVDLSYTPRQGISHYVSLDAFDRSIQLNDMGYLRRNDYRRAAYSLWISRSGLKRFRESRSNLRVYGGWNTGGEMIASKLSFEQEVTRHNLTKLRVEVEWEPARFDDRGSFGNGTFRIDDTVGVEGRYYSDSARRFSYSIRHRVANEPVGAGVYHRSQAFLRWRTTDRMTMALALRYADRDAWLLHRSNGVFATFEAKDVTPLATLSYFVNARQQLLLAFQWVAIKADARRFYRMADTPTTWCPSTGHRRPRTICRSRA